MREDAINETFTHEVYGTLRVQEDKGFFSCEGCYFNQWDKCTNHDQNMTGTCAPETRKDGKGVIFVKVK